MKRARLVIEASALAENRISGIGHMTLEIIKALETHPDNQKKFRIVLAIPFDKKRQLQRWGFKTVIYRSIPVPLRLFNLIWKFDLLPPMDLWLGRGNYIFPNYKNWRLAWSRSFTYICDLGYLLYPQYVSPKNQKFLAKNMPRWVKRTNKILAISKNTKQAIVNELAVNVAKVSVVPCGVDRKVFYRRSQAEIERVKQICGIAQPYLLYLGNLEPRKNIVGLIEAYKHLPPDLRSAYSLALIGGQGWLNRPIHRAIKQAQADGYSIVQAKTYVPDNDLPALHSGASVLVHPAFYEGFGISPLQAMACGTPVIVADNSSLPEVVGSAGLYVKAQDIADISAKMKRLLSNASLQADLAKRGLAQAQKYSWQHSAEHLIQTMESKV